MADQLKELFNNTFYKHLATELSKVSPHFNPDKFVKEVTHNLHERSLNQRLRNTTIVLKKHLPSDYKKSVEVLSKVIPHLNKGYTTLICPDFVGVYGHEHIDVSLEALKYFTVFGSSGFAIREFLKRDFNTTIKVMNKWALDKNPHVRRLASEGSRPRLPWSFKLDEVIKHPEKTLTILEQLKTDEEFYVKKSVANHLNDISKDNTQWMLNVLKNWDNTNMHTLWIKKHASRTLIKKGNTASLALFDFEKNSKVKIEHFKLNSSTLVLGDNLTFEFDIISQKEKSQKLAIDFAIHYVKKSGEQSPKVFKLKELHLDANETLHISKKQVFKDFSTRKHYPGKHMIELLVNGNSVLKTAFELKLK